MTAKIIRFPVERTRRPAAAPQRELAEVLGAVLVGIGYALAFGRPVPGPVRFVVNRFIDAAERLGGAA